MGNTRIAVLASGRGSNMQALIEGTESNFIPATVSLVISDNLEAPALRIAKKYGIKAIFVDPKDKSREEYDNLVVNILRDNNIDLVCLAGFMRVITPFFVSQFKNKILNIHPALLPMFPGMNAQKQALNSKVKKTGCTVHFVDEGVDTGPRVLQAVVDIKEGDTLESLSQRILKQEHRIYPLAVRLFVEGRIKVENYMSNIKKGLPEVTIDDRGYEALLKDFKYNNELISPKISSVLVSVSDKRGAVDFIKELKNYLPSLKVIATGGTAKLLSESIKVREVSEITKFPECFDGRVKTLHPAIVGGILMDRDKPEHLEEADQLNIDKIDLVLCNLYPFSKYVESEAQTSELIENIDIGGVTLIRSAAKNYRHVAVVVDPDDYSEILEQIMMYGEVPEKLREELACKAFKHIADYDEMISKELDKRFLNKQRVNFQYSFEKPLRYGENPHQQAKFYFEENSLFHNLKQLNGKELSFNNIVDIDAAWMSMKDIANSPSVSIVKHTNPCGYATGNTLAQAFKRAWQGDDVSAFGSVIAFSREVDEETASLIRPRFIEVIIAPSFSDKALEILTEKKDLRILAVSHNNDPDREYRYVNSGILVQNPDKLLASELKIVTVHDFIEDYKGTAIFAYKAVKHVKSNAIVVARSYKDNCYQVLGIGAGQPNRINSVRLAIEKAKENLKKEAAKLGLVEQRYVYEQMRQLVLASDAFFPFADSIDVIYKAGIRNIIQPGGSKKDQEVIEACNRHGISMVFTGTRHFKH